MYHENVCLILHKLSKYTNLAATFDGLVAQLTCNNSIKECFYRQCEDCKDSFNFFVPPPDVKYIATKYIPTMADYYKTIKTITKRQRKFRSMQLLGTSLMI